MKLENFWKLSFRQQDTLIIAMHIRNSLEEFHGRMADGSDGFITDEQMKLLNQTIRRAVLEALLIRDKVIRLKDAEKRKEWEKEYEWLIMCIPEYWEIPTEKEYILKRKKWAKKLLKII